jgi:hypothetical protein
MHVTGDKTHILVQVNTNFGLEVSEQEFLILDDDTEEIVMGVSWHRALMTEEYRGLIDIVDAEDDPRYSRRYFEVGQDEAREDRLMAESTMEVFPEFTGEAWEQCEFNGEFPDLDRLVEIVRRHGEKLFQPFDREGLRVEPLELQVQRGSTFRMQPCRYVRGDVLTPLKKMIDQFESEGVMVRQLMYIRKSLSDCEKEGWRYQNGCGLSGG